MLRFKSTMRGFEFSARELSSLVNRELAEEVRDKQTVETVVRTMLKYDDSKLKPWQTGYIIQHKWFLLLSWLELLAYVA